MNCPTSIAEMSGKLKKDTAHRVVRQSSHGRKKAGFAFKTGDLVLVKWSDGMVYFAKIKRIDKKRQKCAVVFDDKSQDEAHYSQIHSGKCTTSL